MKVTINDPRIIPYNNGYMIIEEKVKIFTVYRYFKSLSSAENKLQKINLRRLKNEY